MQIAAAQEAEADYKQGSLLSCTRKCSAPRTINLR